MRPSVLKELLLYRYRFILGYGILVFLCIGLTVWQLDAIPAGFSDAEKQSAVISNSLTHQASSFVNAPYHMVQKATLAVFGASPLGIRLPSVLAAIAVAAGAYFLLRRWFGESVAVMGAILVVSSVYFLARGRMGSPEILYYLWPTLLLLTATLANAQGRSWRFWVWAFAVCAGLALYTPYLSLLAVIILATVFASRLGRILVADIGGPALALAIVTFLALASPLLYTIYLDPSQITAYAGSFNTSSLTFAVERGAEFARQIGGFSNVDGGLSPALSIPAIAFLLYGLLHVAKNISRTRYAIITLWLFVSALLYFSIETASSAILFVPIALLIIVGLHRFINRWYELFPRNPYARVAAIVPILLLLVVMVQFSYQRYFYVLPKSESIRANFDGDISLLRQRLAAEPRINSLTVATTVDEVPFTQLVENRLVRVVSVDDPTLRFDSGELIIAENAYNSLPQSTKDSLAAREVRLIVDSRPGDDAIRFRQY